VLEEGCALEFHREAAAQSRSNGRRQSRRTLEKGGGVRRGWHRWSMCNVHASECLARTHERHSHGADLVNST